MEQRKLMQIGQIAKIAGVNVQTLRYYEKRQIIEPEQVKESGYRLYTLEAVKTVSFVKHAQELGFSLDEIRGLLNLRVPSASRCEKVKKSAKTKLAGVQDKINMLRKLEKTLKTLIKDCDANKLSNACPIIESMEEDS